MTLIPKSAPLKACHDPMTETCSHAAGEKSLS